MPELRRKIISPKSFEIELGAGGGTISVLSFEDVGISAEVSKPTIGVQKQGYNNRPTPGPRKPGNPRLTALFGEKDLWDWYDKAHPVGGTGADVTGNLQNCRLIGKDADDKPIFTIELDEVMPTTYEGPDADSASEGNAEEKLELVCSYADRSK